MKSKLVNMYYSNHNIEMTNEMAKSINHLCGLGVSFFLVIDRLHDKLYKIIVGNAEDAEAECNRLQREFGDEYCFIFDYIHS